jgi:hypothetical protein
VGVERFIWTDHAELRLEQRGLTRFEVEEAVREGHEIREPNHGDADWRVEGVRADGRKFAVIYDNPVRGEENTVCVVSAWRLRGNRRSRQAPKPELF